MSRLWDKGAPLDERVLQFTAGEDHALDERLVSCDVRASIAHAQMLQAQGLLSAPDCNAICTGLSALGAAHARGEWRIELADEDGQTALERRLTASIGAAGARIHLGRSRNDQVLTALRLYMREALTQLAAGVQRRAGCNPLGSAAGYGTPGLALDRNATTRALGFASTQEPVTAVQLSRGKAEAQLLFETTLLMQDLGRLATDLLLFYTQEFAFVALPEAFTTGSSIMPQKRNPDVLELVRGRAASALACLTEALVLCAKLPSGYQRDLQLLKAPLFRGIDLCGQSLDVLIPLLDALQFRAESVKIDPAVHTAGQAYALVVQEGLPFREAYRRIAARFTAGRK